MSLSCKTAASASSLQEASSLIDKATVEERKLYLSNAFRDEMENEERKMEENAETPPPAPVLLSRTDTSLTFAPAPYNLEGQVRLTFWLTYICK